MVPGRPRLDGEPRDEQRGCDVVGQVGDDAHRTTTEKRPRIEGERIRGDDFETAGIMFGDLPQRRDGALVAFDRDHAGGAECQERARKAAGTRADLQHRHAGECSRGAGYARREIEVEQEILSEGFFGDEVMPANNFA